MRETSEFVEFVESQTRSLLRAGWLLTGDWAAAEDLVQTALAKAWQRWDRATGQGTPEAYVRAIMMSTYLAWRRRRWTGELSHDIVPDSAGAMTDDDYARVDDRRSVQSALRRLSAQQRAAVVLRYFADLSEADTAAAMGCSPGAVKSHTSRALARLRDDAALAAILTGEGAR